MVDPRTAHLIDGRILLSHLRQVSQSDLPQIRMEFARYLTTGVARQHASWQEAWNAWTGATPGRSGCIRYTPSRCPGCHGKGFDVRHAARNISTGRLGNPYVCPECHGNRRSRPTMAAATFIREPEAANSASEDAQDGGEGQ